MKLVLLTEQWEGIGGIQRYLRGLAEHLEGVTVEHEHLRRRWQWPDWRGTYQRLAKRVEAGELDVLLCGKALFEGLVAQKLYKTHGLPYVVFTYAMEIKKWSQSPKERKKLERVLEDADQVSYINDITKQHLQQLGVNDTQLLKVPPGIEQRHFSDVSDLLIDATLNRYQISIPYILSVGRLIPRKGFDNLIESFAQLDQVHHGDLQLVIVGDGSELQYLQKVAEEEFINTSVKFLTDVPDKHLPALYAGAELFALTPKELPNDLEGFGIVYLEAAAHGVPAIGTKTGGIPEAVRDGETGLLIPPNDVKATTQTLTKVLTDQALKTSLGTAAAQRAQRFRWDHQANILTKALKRVIE